MQRRHFLAGSSALGLTAVLGTPALAEAAPHRGANIYADSHYRQGMYLMPVTPSTTPRQILDFGRPGVEPIWHLDEWNTHHSIADSPVRRFDRCEVPGLPGGGIGYASAGKRVARSPSGMLWLEVFGSAEYEHPRQPGETWPHLLIEQDWSSSGRRLVDLRALELALRVRVDHIHNRMKPADYDPALHAAQVTLYLTVQNLNHDSPDYGGYVWFGVPIVDNRYDIPPEYLAQDGPQPGTTNQFIATMDGRHFWSRSLKDRRWHRTRVNLVPFMHYAFAQAQDRGYLADTSVDDLYITTSNLGWEIPGTFDAALEFEPLSVRALPAR